MIRFWSGLKASGLMLGFVFLSAAALVAAPPAAKPATSKKAAPAPLAAAPPPVKVEVEPLLAPEIGSLAISADGSQVYASFGNAERGGVENVYAVPGPGGHPEALTQSEDASLRLVSTFPGDDRLLLVKGESGGDPQRLVVREKDGSLTELTAGKPSRFLGWKDDASSFLVEQDERSSHSSDSFEVATDGYERKPFYQNASFYPLAAVSPQRRFLELSEIVSEAVQNLRVKDRETGQQQILRSGEGLMVHIPVGFSADGKQALYLADTANPYRYLEQLDPITSYQRPLVHEGGDIYSVALSPDGRYAAVVVAQDNSAVLHLYNAKTWGRLGLTGLPEDLGGVGPVAFSRDGNAFAFVASSARSAQQIYLFDTHDPNRIGEPRTLLAGLPDALAAKLVAAEPFALSGAKGKKIPAFVLRPEGAGPQKKVPAVVFVHDGPAGVVHPGYQPLWQYLVRRGYAVLAVNHRGSLGFGKDHLRGDDQQHGQSDLDDLIAGKQALAASGWVDPARIAIVGSGKHGGFLALAALAFQPQEFAAGADLFGVADWIRMVKSVPVTTLIYRALTDEFGSPYDAQTSRHLSPLAHVQEIAKPLFMVQGAKDTAASAAEAEAIAGALQGRKVPVQLVTLPDEAGSLTRWANQAKIYTALADFLDQNVKPAAKAPAKPAGKATPKKK